MIEFGSIKSRKMQELTDGIATKTVIKAWRLQGSPSKKKSNIPTTNGTFWVETE